MLGNGNGTKEAREIDGHANGKEMDRWPAKLAAIWCKTRPEDDQADMERKFGEYRRQGYPGEELEGYLRHSRRNGNELFWKFGEYRRQGYPGEELEGYLRHSRRNGNELFWKFDSRIPPPPAVPFPALKARVRELQSQAHSLGMAKMGSQEAKLHSIVKDAAA